MHKTVSLAAAAAVLALLITGCAGPEEKFGRGLRDITEFGRLGEIRRSMEQSALFDSPDVAYTTGFVQGFNKSLARTGLGVFEIVTAPFGPYDPICTHYLPPHTIYPDSYVPHLVADPTFSPDAALGFFGGDVAPIVVGSRFRIFDY
jgi:putative exosortase-associated protein (TIGR04073 family)